MPIFSYKAIDHEGTVVKGMIEEINLQAAIESISAAGLHMLNISQTSEYVVALKGLLARRQKIKREDIIEFANNLAVMLRAGVPILSGLTSIAQGMENKYFQSKIDNMAEMLEHGSSFSNAIKKHSDIFPNIFNHLVLIGEETGRLDKSLEDVAIHLQRMEDLAGAIKGALIYPTFALVTTFGAMMFWMLYVLPKIMDVFKSMQVTLPPITRGLLWTSEFVQKYKYPIFLLPVSIILIYKALRKYDKTRFYIDLMLLKMPIVKLIVYNKLLALYAEQMRILTVAGITIDRALEIVCDLMENDVFKRAIEIEREDITTGSRISDAMRKHWIFPPLVTRMVDIGEASGNLDEQYGYVGDYYLKKLHKVSQNMSKMIEPIVIGVIGFMFGIIIIGLMLPIYDLIAEINAG
ncbi:MAG: type II secretion system F family protein [Nitrospirae bacterium]|nr:type II secretion system F family protein [Nitrospirota bacterium]